MKWKSILLSLFFISVVQPVFSEFFFYIPQYNPDSVAFFASETQNALSIDPKFNLYASLFSNNYDSGYSNNWNWGSEINNVLRMSVSAGLIVPIWEYISLAGHYSFAWDDADIVESFNYFTGGGIIGHSPFGSLGVFTGYYNNSVTNYWHIDGQYDWDPGYRASSSENNDDIKFAIAPIIDLSSYIFFLDKLGGYFDFNKDLNFSQFLAKLAFSTIQFGASKLGIDLYYKRDIYNMLLDQEKIGASFSIEYLGIDFGYRRFLHKSVQTSNFQDGIYGRIIGKIPIYDDLVLGTEKIYLVLSAAIERNTSWVPTFGIGIDCVGFFQDLIEMGYKNKSLNWNNFAHINCVPLFENIRDNS